MMRSWGPRRNSMDPGWQWVCSGVSAELASVELRSYLCSMLILSWRCVGQMRLKRIQWAVFRIFSYSIVFANLMTFGCFLYIIAPYTSYFFFNDLRFWKHWSTYYKFFGNTISYITTICIGDSFLLISHLPLAAPPMNIPDMSKFRLSPHWKLSNDSCGECSACCTLTSNCCFRDKSTHKCRCYGSLFWNYFNCGRFPTSQEQLEHYGCKKFEAIRSVKKWNYFLYLIWRDLWVRESLVSEKMMFQSLVKLSRWHSHCRRTSSCSLE